MLVIQQKITYCQLKLNSVRYLHVQTTSFIQNKKKKKNTLIVHMYLHTKSSEHVEVELQPEHPAPSSISLLFSLLSIYLILIQASNMVSSAIINFTTLKF